jgi:hypothetical protein
MATRDVEDHRPLLIMAQDEGRDATYQPTTRLLGSS